MALNERKERTEVLGVEDVEPIATIVKDGRTTEDKDVLVTLDVGEGYDAHEVIEALEYYIDTDLFFLEAYEYSTIIVCDN